MKKLLNLKNIAIALLIVVVVFQQCGGNKKGTGEIVKIDGKKYELIKHEIDTIEVVKTKVVTKKGEDIYHETIKEVTIPTIVDTQALLQDYFAKNIYKDTLNLPDSLGTVSLIDTITQNKILGRTFNASVKQRTIKETTIVKELPKNQVYWGFNGGFNKEDVVSNVSAGLILKTKKDKLVQLNIGVANSNTATGNKMSPYVGVGMYWKIKLKK